ncbi:hypothetical protein GCM10009850_107110 [Nonomuraea monospora]|uniref:Uncharacterized protein n=1 Tax=Nonomuraea monospora TaxID=568818 RepID=A0ABP5PUG8_9ACTN
MRDEEGRALAATIQQRHPGWLIMWSPWRRRLSAFACWHPTRPVVIDAQCLDDLLNLMFSEEMTAHYGDER